MYEGNPGEIDFGSSSREIRVSVGSSYRESTVEERKQKKKKKRERNKKISILWLTNVLELKF